MPEGLMRGNIANVRGWATKSDIDWFSHFIRAWIPFNAWFQNAFEEESERKILLALKSGTDNPLRSSIVRLLARGNDEDALDFKNHIAKLHNRLEARDIRNKGRRLSFCDCYIGENPTNSINAERGWNGSIFTLERGTGRAIDPNDAKNKSRIFLEMQYRNRILFTLPQNRYNEQEVCDDNQFVRLRREYQGELLARYKRINPALMIDLTNSENSLPPVGLASARVNTLTVGAYEFCNHPEHIFAGLMEILYSLRCILFHGEIAPTEENNEVYEPAYFILRRFLKCIV